MSIYCIKIKYTKEAIRGMMEEGVDRADAMRNLTEALGQTFIFLWNGRAVLSRNGNFRGS